MRKSETFLRNTEVASLIAFVQEGKHSMHDLWLLEEGTGIGTVTTISCSCGQKKDITDYGAW